MSRTYSSFIRFIANYLYFRRNGRNFRTAWRLVGMTLP